MGNLLVNMLSIPPFSKTGFINHSLKSDPQPPKKNHVICFNETPLMMKNAIYFTLKALPVLKIFKFLS